MAPPINAGSRLMANFRPGPWRIVRGILAFLRVARTPIADARTASAIHVKNHCSRVSIRLDTRTARRAVTPIRTPPQPGTAVNEPARSIVSRI